MKKIILFFIEIFVIVLIPIYSFCYTNNDELEKQVFMKAIFRTLMGIGIFLIVLYIIEYFKKINKKREKEKQTEDDSESQALELLIEKMQKEKDKKV